jgi:hypothetical protein
MYTSLNCLEHSDEHKAVRLGNIAALHHAKTKSGKKISARNALAIIKSGRVRELGRVHSKPLEMKHAGKDDDPSYVKMTGLPADNSDILLLDALAAECSQDFCLFRDIDQSGAFSW